MEQVRKIEDTLKEWLKPLPHLPTEWRKWLASNSWWLTLISVIFSVLTLLALVGTIMDAMSLRGLGFYGYYVPQMYSGMWFFSTAVSLIFLLVSTTVSAMSVSPLKAMNKKGWDLLFFAFLVSITSSVVNLLLTLNIVNLLFGLISIAISAAVGAYILFEVRNYFKVEAKRVVKKAKK